MRILYHPRNKCNINYTILGVDMLTGIITYKIISGALPIKVELIGQNNNYSNTHSAYGQYQFTGVANENYDFKITDNKKCTKQESIAQCTSCPDGYSAYGDKCVKITEVTPNYSPPMFTIVKAPGYSGYGQNGGLIFSSFNLNGTGIAEPFALNPLNPYWANPYGSTTNGLMNRYCIWATTTYNNQLIGFSFCFNVVKGKILYVAVCIDDWAKIKINGEVVLDQDEIQIQAQFGFRCYNAWFIYPIYFSAGDNVVEIYARNRPWMNNINPAAVGAAIYDATKADLIAARSDADLAGKILWTSLEMIGENLVYEYSDEHGYHGYSCPDGYALNACGETVVCQLKETINCPE